MEKKEVVCGYCCCHCADTRCHGNKEEYKEGIRREYGDVPDRLFYPRRKKFLTKVLENCFIFFNPYLEEKYRKQALVNVKTELKEIEARNIKN